ncbi:MAG: multicopper oxidase domain-containing protein [Pseudobdellovibrionaceae bacterium]
MKTRKTPSILTFVMAFIFSNIALAKTVRYELTIRNQKLNISGKKEVDFALTVNGGIPAPTLEFTEGDHAEILVKNELPNEEASIHWHGILLPPLEDGVAYVNTPPIYAGRSRLFKFTLRQHGTYWYHSHTMVQEQKGVYGAIVIHPKKETIKVAKEVVAVLSDWSDENADQIIRNLRKDGDYYLYKKDSVRSYLGALNAGGLKGHLKNEWDRMGGMDLSDVGYDAFLINGKRDSQLLVAHPGEKVRVRIINAAASSYFYVSLGQIPMQVISADGVDIEPMQAKELLIGMAETYDILFTVPEHKNFELRATVQDVTGYASGWIGMGEKVNAPEKPQPDLYATMDHASMDHSKMDHGSIPMNHSKMNHTLDAPVDHSKMDHSKMNHGAVDANLKGTSVETLTVDDIQAPVPTTLPKEAKLTEIKLVLGGDMERYVWHINGQAIHEDRNILINEGDVVRFTFENDTMMHHPMHLHGHFFRVLNQFGERSPLKHTVDVPPHGTRTIEFYANEPGQWMLHCHNLYHMKTGMARVVKYMSFTPPPEIQAHEKHDPHLHDHMYYTGLVEAATNHAQLYFKASQTWNEYEIRGEGRNLSNNSFNTDEKWEFEGDALYRRWFNNFFNVIAGGTAFDKKTYGMVGVGYLLPMLVETQTFVNHEGKFRLDLEKRFQWTKTIFTDAEFTWRPNWEEGHENEFEISLMYGPQWNWAAGLMFTNESTGVGLQVKF